MLQVIKLVLIDDIDLVEKKCRKFMKYKNKDLDDEFSISSQISRCDFFEVELSCESSLVVNCKGECSLYFDLLDKSGVNYLIEDVTNIYFKNQLCNFVPEKDMDKLNRFLLESLSVNDVLDKISESGIDSLNDIDKMVLQRA
jgi:hypothetical protein